MEALKPSNILIMQGVLFWIPGFLDLNVTGHNDDLDYQWSKDNIHLQWLIFFQERWSLKTFIF